MDGDRLRALLADGGSVLMAGVYDALTARLAVEAGFDVVFVSGYCTAATQLGLPDFGYLTQTEIVDTARRVCRRCATPDRRRRRHRLRQPAQRHPHRPRADQDAGAAGFFLEDQQWPKKCGHMAASG